MYVWDTPRYSPAEAGRLTGLRSDRIRRWLRGYEYNYSPAGSSSSRRILKGPVVRRQGAAESPYASFLDLVDLLFVERFLRVGHSLQKIRKALIEADEIIGGHHFAQRCYFTDGREIYLQVRNKGAENLLQLLSGGQWVIAEVIREFARQIDFDQSTGFAEKWYPAGKNGRIVLDPRVAFGAPSVVGKGVRTANVHDMFIAEAKNTDAVANWMNIEPQDVVASVDFESSLAA